MKKVLFFFVALSLIATAAMAKDVTGRFGLGFWDSDAPIGGRYWFSEKMAFDGGIGFSVLDDDPSSRTNFYLAAGLPINVHNMGDRVNFNFVPAITFGSIDNGDGFDSTTMFSIAGVLEFEVFVTDDFSVSASHGVAAVITSPGGPEGSPSPDSTTDFGSFGANMTDFGFHYYLTSN